MRDSPRSGRWIFSLARRAERWAALAQGKGYGTSTIEQENRLVHALLAQPPRLALDIGGNVGDYTAELRRRTPDLEIHVFEPDAGNQARLAQRFAGDARIHRVAAAVSDQAGQATLYADTPGSGMASLVQRRLDHFGLEMTAQQSTPVLRLEDYWAGALDARVMDIVKIDIEGHELAALRGFGRALAATRLVQFEFGGTNIDARTYFQDFWYFFREHGFSLQRITPFGLQFIDRYRESDEAFVTTNFVAVNERGAMPGTPPGDQAAASLRSV